MATSVESRDTVPHHSLTPSDVAELLETDLTAGLASDRAQALLQLHGPNRVGHSERWIRLKRLSRQFADVLIWILLVAAGISGLVLGEWVDAGAIVAIVALNAVLGYVQESKAEAALDKLEALEAPTATVIRDGAATIAPATGLVPGDVIQLEAGDAVPADGRVASSSHMECAEAALTGESLPVSKSSQPVTHDAGLGDRASMVFAGTTVVRGRGRAVVTTTGLNTEMGKIAAALTEPAPPTPLEVEMGRIGRRLALVAIVAGLLIMGTGLLQDYPIETMVLTSVALAVAAIPEGLPAVITATLAGGTTRMANRAAIVRRLPAVEALGAVNVICTDKTGTLTKSELAVDMVAIAGRSMHLSEIDPEGHGVTELIETAVLCNDSRQSGDKTIGDPTETALIDAVRQAGVDVESLRSERPRIDEVAFDSRRKRMSTIHDDPEGGHVIHTKGAPEVIIDRASHWLSPGGVAPIDENTRGALLAEADDLAAQGYRTLAFAVRHLSELPDDPAEAEIGMTYEGVVGLHDEVRPEVADALAKARGAGVRTVMVTGDHVITARSVADTIGLEGEIMGGDELRATGSRTLSDHIGQYSGFARVDPIDKVKIVDAWRDRGSIVAMTGDGINDAPALKTADIGVAMGSGTDIARASSDLVLTDDNYATIVAAIDEGRRIFRNLRNVVHYLLSANASEVIYMVVGFIAFGFLGEPLLAVQLLWINLLSDALPALALGIDRPAVDLMNQMPGGGRNILSRRNLAILVGQGTILATASIATLLVGHYVMDLEFTVVRTMVFTTLVVAQLLHAINVRSDDEARISMPQPALIGAILTSATLQILIIYTSFGHSIFRTASLSVTSLAAVAGFSALSMAGVRLMNRIRHRAV